MILSFGRDRRPVPSAPFLGVAPLRVVQIGDSLTAERLSRRAIQREVQQYTADVEFVGTKGMDQVTGGIIGSQDMSYWAHDGVGGDTIAMCTARIETIAAALGEARAPHIVIDRSGTNDVSALRDLADILADKRAHLAAIRAAWPSAWIVIDSIPTIRSGSASGVTWEAKRDLRDAYVAELSGLAASFARCSYVDGYGGTAAGTSHPPQEISSDGIHPGTDEDGYRRDGTRLGREILRLAGIPWERRIISASNAEGSFRPALRQAQAAIVFDNSGTSGVTWTSHVNLTPEAQSFALEMHVQFGSVAAGLYAIAGLNSNYPSGYMLARDGAGLRFYLGNAGPVFSGTAGYSANVFEVDTPYHIAVVCDRANAYVGWALNGKVVQYVNLNSPAYGGVNWDLAASTFYLGKFPAAFAGFEGKIKGVAFYKGANAPTIYDLPRFAQQTYVDGIYWDGLTALFRLDEGTGSPAEAAGATGAGTLAGAAAWGSW